jgi:hypothetical protein
MDFMGTRKPLAAGNDGLPFVTSRNDWQYAGLSAVSVLVETLARSNGGA